MTTRRKHNGGKRSRPKGKRGEKSAATLLSQLGWFIDQTETAGLAGDDIFACDPKGKWWSVEVKNTVSCHAPKFVGQAKRQAVDRYGKLQEILAEDSRLSQRVRHEQMDTFTKNDWLVLWHPSNCNARSDEWATLTMGSGGYTRFRSLKEMMNE